jgi:predicted DNA-binding transcriptional regulator AlpA
MQDHFIDKAATGPPGGGMWVLNLNEAAGRCGFTRRFLEKLIAEGRGPATIKFGQRRVGVLADDLADWIQLHRRPSPVSAIDEPAPSAESI